MIALILALASLSNDPATAPRLCPRLWWGDWNGDGRLDVVRGLPGAPARLLENQGAGAFADVSEAAGWPPVAGLTQVAFADLDGDGQAELALVAGGRVRLFARDGEVLVERTERGGLATLAGVTELRTLDVDGDGLPELWLTQTEGERVLRRTPGGVFEELDLGLPLPLPVAVASLPAAARGAEKVEAPQPETLPVAEERAAGGDQRRGRASGAAAGAATRVRPALDLGARDEGDPEGSTALAGCSLFIRDTNTGNCLQAFTVPQMGHLYALSNDFNLDLAGRIGLGTTAQTHKLTVDGGSSNDVARLIGSGSFGEGAKLNFGDADYVHLAEVTDDKLEISATGGTNFTGNVGIGQPSPGWALDVRKPQAVARLATQTSTNGSVIELRNEVLGPNFVGALNFVNSVGQTRGQIAYTGGNDLAIKVNNTERARFYASGAVYLFGPLAVNVATAGNTAYFENQSTAQYSGAMVGFSNGPDAGAVLGWNNATSGSGAGVQGITSISSGYGVLSLGDFGGTGAKYFVQPHPTDASKEIRFVSLEGNESGTYFRGRAHTVGGQAVIDVPEDFRLVTEAEGLTVQTTPIGAPAVLWIESQDLDRIVVRANVDVEFSYFANGVRRGFAGLETVRPNAAYVPRERGVPYGAQYRPAHRRILVENGTLNPDFTPSEATAARLGWTLTDAATPAPETVLEPDSLHQP